VAVKTIKLNEAGTGLSAQSCWRDSRQKRGRRDCSTHPNIVVVFDAGEEDGLYYITMELVEGKSLQRCWMPVRRSTSADAAHHGADLQRAASSAHERNVVHRDIKPANLMLTGARHGEDYGLRHGEDSAIRHGPANGPRDGTPSYMSPEQVKGRAVDGRSDIFSLGVMLYEMVTGEKPFPGQN